MIRWDALLTRHTARELDRLLAGERVRALRLDGASRDLVLLLRERALLWRLHPTRGQVRVLPPLEPAEGDLTLRSRVLGVESVPDERILRLSLAPTGSGRPTLTLVVELLGNQWNAALTEGDGDNGEVETVRHVLWRRDAGRSPRVGHPYAPPHPMARRGVEGDTPLEEWLGVLARIDPPDRAAALVRTFAWTSPLNAAAMLGAGATALDDTVASGRTDDERVLSIGHARWTRMARPDAVADPVVLETEGGPLPYPFPLPGTPHRPARDLLTAIEASLPAAAGDDILQAAPAEAGVGPALMRRLEGAARRAARREKRLQAESAAVEDPEVLRGVGDLILARYGEIPPGAERVRLTGFDGVERTVELDPAERPHGNAAIYYERAGKAARARLRLPSLVAEARAERDRLDALVTQAREGAVDASAIRDALGPLPSTGGPQPTGPSLPYRSYRSSGGLEIRVGRGARHNDDLTFRHSSPGDVWLHARDNAGAHVILRWQGPGNPPARDLGEAATLAALHSKARTSGSAPVDWTLRKHVRKPRKAPPGRVVAERVQTLFVEPDPELLDRLERIR